MSDIRYDLFTDRYVIVAPRRAQRPGFLQSASMPQNQPCPFCEGNESMTPPEIYAIRPHGGANEKGWKTRVVPNRYNALAIEADTRWHRAGSFEWQEGFGAHEIVIDMPRHTLRMDQWQASEFSDWLATLQARAIDLHRDFRLVWLSIFKNHGVHAGATQAHPHTQILALPMIPKAKLVQLEHHVRYFREHGKPICEVLRDQELAAGERVVVQNDRFVAIVPFGSANPFEVWVTPKTAIGSLMQLNPAEIDALSGLLVDLFGRMYGVLGNFDFNLWLEMAPLQKDGASEAIFEDAQKACRLGLRIVPRVTGMGGFELHSGMQINPLAPEEAAKLLRRGRL